MNVVAQPPITEREGSARLRIERVAGQCAVVSSFSTSPLKLMVPRARGTSVWAYTSSFGGGLVAGDQTQLELELGAETRCFLGTQASTKVYRNPRQRPCSHVTRAQLRAGSILVLAPDPVQAFAQSRYAQHQRFDLAADASLVLVDALSSGRRARGEQWAFCHYSSRIEIRVDNRLAFLDALRLDPADGDLSARHRGGLYHCLATLVMLGPACAQLRSNMLEVVGATPVSQSSPSLCSASPFPGGAVLRLAAEEIEPVLATLQKFLEPCQQWLGDNPWLRKW